ncbi:DnaJ domain-containing protein, partial [Dimargaris cristalligena]
MEMWDSFLGWAILPNFLISFLQKQYYSFRPADQPPPGSARYRTHNRRFYTLVVVAYLVYSIGQALYRIPPNHYQLLQVDPSNFTPKELRTNFRRLSLQHHPDKSASGDETMMIRLRQAYEALNDPAKRLGYEVMGSSYLKCSHCSTFQDYVREARSSLMGHYIRSGIMLVIFHFINKDQFGRVVRIMGIILLASLELYLLTRVNTP